jgi:hypothetical protein
LCYEGTRRQRRGEDNILSAARHQCCSIRANPLASSGCCETNGRAYQHPWHFIRRFLRLKCSYTNWKKLQSQIYKTSHSFKFVKYEVNLYYTYIYYKVFVTTQSAHICTLNHYYVFLYRTETTS